MNKKDISTNSKLQTPNSKLFLLGHFLKTHALKGELVIELFYSDSNLLKKIKTVFIDSDGKLLKYSLVSSRLIQGKKAIILLDKITSIEQAGDFAKKPVYFSSDYIKKGDSFFPQQLVGFKLMDEKKGLLGEVEYIYPLNNQYIISYTQNGKEILIPLNEQIVINIDHGTEQIFLRIPDGLIEVYL